MVISLTESSQATGTSSRKTGSRVQRSVGMSRS